MDLDELSFSKKPEEVRVIRQIKHPFRKTHIYIGKIVPTTMINNGSAYEITEVDDSLIIDGFAITTYEKENYITTLNIFGEHPNCDMNTNVYCWPEHKKGLQLNQASLLLIMSNLKTYYLDSAYFIPAKHLIEYKKIDSMLIRVSKGE